MAWGYGIACPKPTRAARDKADRKLDRLASDRAAKIRAYVKGREREVCRCCRIRDGESSHELRFKSLGGKVSRTNTVYVCGQLVGSTPSCHTYLQLNQIDYDVDERGAEGPILFTPKTRVAAEWLKVKLGEQIVSPVMLETEIA